jgi:hypothetical protein
MLADQRQNQALIVEAHTGLRGAARRGWPRSLAYTRSCPVNAHVRCLLP